MAYSTNWMQVYLLWYSHFLSTPILLPLAFQWVLPEARLLVLHTIICNTFYKYILVYNKYVHVYVHVCTCTCI